jgi:hypothetical protein
MELGTCVYFEEDNSKYKTVNPFEFGIEIKDFLLLTDLKPVRMVM